MARGRWNQTGPATAIGLLAPVCWGMSVSLVRGIAENFGMAQGQFFLYLIAAVSLYFTVGLPNFRTMNRKYLFIGIPTAVASGLTFVLAIFTSDGGAQTLEVGMVNYLWPSLTILFAVLFNGVRGRWWLWLGVVVALYGILRILGGDEGLSWSGFCERFAHNPISYILALGAALTWAGFSSMTRAWGGGAQSEHGALYDRHDDLRPLLVFRLRCLLRDARLARDRERRRGWHRDGKRLRLLGARHAAREHHPACDGFLLYTGAFLPFRCLLARRRTYSLLLGGGGARHLRLHSLLERDEPAFQPLKCPTVPSVTRSFPPKSFTVRTAEKPACWSRLRQASP